MKILEIKLKNLNSLRGEHKLTLDAPPLSDAGVFAITGPTGAGKSTLLDALTLALYNHTARLGGKPKETVVSRGQSDAYAEARFLCKSGVYTARWEITLKNKRTKKIDEKAKDDEWDVKMRISDEAQNIICEKLSEVPDKVQELTGLDADRFLRSVLLAQLRFNEFINAGPKDRADLLEKITGGEIYTEIAEKTREFYAEKKKAVEEFRQARDSINVLSSEAENGLRAEKENKVRELNALAVQISAENGALKNVEKKEKLASEAQILKQEKDKIKEEKESFEAAQAGRLGAHERAQSLNAERALLKEKETQKLKAEEKFRQASSDAGNADLNLQQANARRLTADAEKQKTETEYKELFPKIKEAEKKDGEIKVINDKINEINRELNGIEEKETQNKSALIALEEELTSEQKKLDEARAYLETHARDADLNERFLGFQSDLKQLFEKEDEIEKLKQTLAENEKYREETTEKIAKEKENIEKFLKAIQELEIQRKTFIDERKFLLGENTAEVLSNRQTELNRLLDLHKQRKQIAAFYLETQKIISDNTQKNAEAGETLHRLQKDAETLANERLTLTQAIESLDSQIETAKARQSLDAHRAALKDDEPCPLCGSVHHPYRSDTPNIETKALENERKIQQTALTRNEKQQSENDKQIAATQANEINFQHNLKDATVKSDQYNNDFAQLSNELGLFDEILETEKLSLYVKNSENELKTLSQNLTELNGLNEKIEKLNERIENGRTKVAEVEAKIKPLENEISGLIAKIETDSARLEIDTQAAQTNRVDFTEKLAPYGLNIPSTKDKANWDKNVENRINAYKTQKENEQTASQNVELFNNNKFNLTEKAKEYADEISLKQKNTDEKRGEIDKLQKERRELLGDERTDAANNRIEKKRNEARENAQNAELDFGEKKITFKEAQKKLSETQKEYVEAEKNYQTAFVLTVGKAVSLGFADLNGLEKAILNETEREKLNNKRAELEKAFNEKNTLYIEKSKEYEAFLTEIPNETRLLPEIKEVIRQLEANKNEAHQKIGEFTQQMDENERQKSLRAEKEAALQAAEQDFAPWQTLSDLICPERKGGGKEKFKMFAQSLIFEILLHHANARLNGLHDRYALQKAEAAKGAASEGLEFVVVDSYQADAKRNPKTLSGGETFLTSLALALGLSDMAAGKNKIDTLFIDEGFGTLDKDTLDRALEALERLQNDGKNVGLISHVPEIKERFPVRVEIIPSGGGNSSIKIETLY